MYAKIYQVSFKTNLYFQFYYRYFKFKIVLSTCKSSFLFYSFKNIFMQSYLMWCFNWVHILYSHNQAKKNMQNGSLDNTHKNQLEISKC